MTEQSDPLPRRRQFVAAVGSLLVSASTAGCVIGDDESAGRSDVVQPGEAGPPPEDDDDEFDHDSDVPDAVREWLERTNEYDGSITDRTDAEEILISAGAGSEGLAFFPAATRIETGTTVTWAWSGAGGEHNVVHDADEPLFDSGEPIDNPDEEYAFTFEETGVHQYVCEPHWVAGMRGVIEVV